MYTILTLHFINQSTGNVQSERFATSLSDGILYRPVIVNEICAEVVSNLQHKPKKGLMIKGPQGIGKSHSIVNVVRKLQSTGNYLVTFIPDCESWTTSFDLVKFICDSFGASYNVLGLPYFKQRDAYNDEIDFPEFIQAIDAVLKNHNKQWVFVFDQINRLFARYPEKKDVGFSPFRST